MSTSRARRARRSGVPYIAVHAEEPVPRETGRAIGALAAAASRTLPAPTRLIEVARLINAIPAPPVVKRKPFPDDALNTRFAGHRHSEEARAKMRAAWARRKQGRG